jgi:hypothetical protein
VTPLPVDQELGVALRVAYAINEPGEDDLV